MLTVLCWNILHGGGPRRLPEIALALLDLAPDVIVLSEYRSARGGALRGVLADHGWHHQACSNPPPRTNGVLIAARFPFEPIQEEPLPPSLAHRWLTIRLLMWDLVLTGLHLPEDQRRADKRGAWAYLLRSARLRIAQRAVFVGDFNTGRHRVDEAGATFACSTQMGMLWSMGYRDAWRETNAHGRAGVPEASWQSPAGASFRIDHAFVSPVLAGAIEGAHLVQDLRERGLSDHTPLRVCLSIEPVSTEIPQKTGLFGHL